MDEASPVLMTDTWSATQQPYAKVLIYDVASGEVQRVDLSMTLAQAGDPQT